MENKKDCCLETRIIQDMLNDYMNDVQEELESINDNDKKIDFLLDIIVAYKLRVIQQYEFDGIQMAENNH